MNFSLNLSFYEQKKKTNYISEFFLTVINGDQQNSLMNPIYLTIINAFILTFKKK